METKLTLNLQAQKPLSLDLADGAQTFDLTMTTPVAGGTSNYERLSHLPQINGVTLSGNKTSSDLNIVSENTAAGWENTPLYIPKAGEICVYSDTAQIKIGDGVVPIVDLPFIGQRDYETIVDALREHIENQVIHVSAEDRARWDNKLNYEIIDDNLIFNKL